MKNRYAVILFVSLLAISLCLGLQAVRVQAQTDPNVIYACVQKNNGQTRIVAAVGNCLPSEVAVSWNKVGPQGDPGPKGDNGVVGPKGDKPSHEWIGTALRFENPTGLWGALVDLKGADGAKGDPGAPGTPGVAPADIEKIQEAICEIFDQSAFSPRPDFCPEPVAECPCWPGITQDQIVAGLSAASVSDKVYSPLGDALGGAGAVTIGDLLDGVPQLSAVNASGLGQFGCKVYGVPTIADFPGGGTVDKPLPYKENISRKQAEACVKDIIAAQQSLNWRVVVP